MRNLIVNGALIELDQIDGVWFVWVNGSLLGGFQTDVIAMRAANHRVLKLRRAVSQSSAA